MAYYTSRIDSNGNEFERQFSSRSAEVSMRSLNLSARSYNSNLTSVRSYINTAAFIEKDRRSIKDTRSVYNIKQDALIEVPPHDSFRSTFADEDFENHSLAYDDLASDREVDRSTSSSFGTNSDNSSAGEEINADHGSSYGKYIGLEMQITAERKHKHHHEKTKNDMQHEGSETDEPENDYANDKYASSENGDNGSDSNFEVYDENLLNHRHQHHHHHRRHHHRLVQRYNDDKNDSNDENSSYRHDEDIDDKNSEYLDKSARLEDEDINDQDETTTVEKFQMEIRSDIVPPLDLQSDDYTTTRDYTYSYRKHCEAAKIVIKPDLAYETWLSAKRKILSDEAARRRKAEEQKKKEQETRKQLSEEKFQEWLENKSRQQSKTKLKPKKVESEKSNKITKPQISGDEAKTKLEQWERAKREAQERRKMTIKQQEDARRELEEQRRHMAAQAWEKWLSEAAKKPKPVPLNRGIFTLRGTISDIYVNPNEWQSTGPIEHNR